MVVVERVTRIFVFRANVIISLSQHNDANCAENKQQNIASIFSDENLFIIMKKKTTIIVHQSSPRSSRFLYTYPQRKCGAKFKVGKERKDPKTRAHLTCAQHAKKRKKMEMHKERAIVARRAEN